MSNLIFPVLTEGWNYGKSPSFNTVVADAVGGQSFGVSLRSMPLWKFTLTYELLSDAAKSPYSDFRKLLGFFLQHRGRGDTFLYEDPYDKSVTDESFGTGNGTLTAFQLKRDFGGFSENIQSINGAPTIKKAGVTQTTPTDYTLGSTGIVTFVAAPANGAALTWTGNYYFRCRFAEDTLDPEAFADLLWELGTVEFESVIV